MEVEVPGGPQQLRLEAAAWAWLAKPLFSCSQILHTVPQLSDLTYTSMCGFFLGGGWFQGTVYVLALGAPSRPTTVHSPPVPQTQHLSVASAVLDHQEDGAGEDEGRELRQAAPQIQPHCPSQELWVSLQGSLWEAWMGISRPQATSRTLNLELDSYRALAFSLQTVPSRSLVDGAMGSSSSATPWAVPGAGEKPEGRLGRGALEGS